MSIKQSLFRKCQSNAVLNSVYCKGSYVKNKVKYWFKLARPVLRYKRNHKNPLFLIYTPAHCNLGDHAIALAEQKILKQMNIDYYEITGESLHLLAAYGFLPLLNGTRIMINGGGNIGNLWMDIEILNRKIVQANPDSTICFMPNSMCYSEDDAGKKELEKTKNIFNAHNNLFIYAREEISYHLMRENFRNVRFSPDLVLSLQTCYDEMASREGCILCLRNDVEMTMTDDQRKQVLQEAKTLFADKVYESSTLSAVPVSPSQREKAVKEKLKEFSSAELVITDRLHGMIFCAITGTKCIVLNSRSPKILGCYKTIENLDYIQFVDNDGIISTYKALHDYPNVYENVYSSARMRDFQNELSQILHR